MARILIHVQHLLGIGHLRRAATLARAAAARGHDVLCVSGGFSVPDLQLGGARLLQLPPARAADASYKTLLGADGQAVDEPWRRERCACLLGALHEFAPDLVLTETFPFGRRAFRFELEALLDSCQSLAVRPRLACSIRDILEGFPGPAGRMQQVVRTLRDAYHRVLVHADPHWVSLGDSFPAADAIEDLVRYTGYVYSAGAGTSPSAPRPDSGEVLVSTGGGAVGLELAQLAIAAAAMDACARRWRLLLGHNLPDADFAALAAAAGANVIVERNRADFTGLLAAAQVSVSQAGYNTVCDLLATRTPAVLVPFRADGQLEQTRRAQLLAARGRASLLTASPLDASGLLAAIAAARACGERGACAHQTRMDGAVRSVELLEELLAC